MLVLTISYSGKHNPGRAEDLTKSNGLSPEEWEENLRYTESHFIKRKRDNGPELTEGEKKRRNLALDNINVLRVVKNTCGLLRLPIELLDTIFQNLDIEHLLILGLQSQHFWNVARRHIQAYCASSCGPWAGEGIICVGEYLQPTDYPPNTLSESEKRELQKGLSESEFWDDFSTDEGSTDFISGPTNLYFLANARYRQSRRWDYLLRHDLTESAALHDEWQRLPKLRRSQISSELRCFKLSYFYPEDQLWVLRNLTTQEYVRSEAIAIKPEYIHGPNIDVLGFGEVVWSRICWSTETDCSMDYTDNKHRGIWAGHRFDITTLHKHKQGSLEGTEWKDVSEEVVNWVDKIWRKEFGSNWRDIIQRPRQQRAYPSAPSVMVWPYDIAY